MIKTFLKGDRIQLHPATDRWMMGDKYGTVVKEVFTLWHGEAVLPDRRRVTVKMDKSGKTIKVHPGNIIEVFSGDPS